MKDHIPDISVLIPVYNGGATIKDAINSVLSQQEVDFEIVIIDDGSTDNTADIINSIADSRIHYFYQNNSGISSALNKGIELSRAKYIARLDGDDRCLPSRLKKQYDLFKKHNNLVMVASSVEFINDQNEVIGRSFPYSFVFLSKKILRIQNIYSHPTVMLKKSIVEKVGGYDISLSGLCEDYHLWNKISKMGRIVNLTTPYVQYRISVGQITDWFPSDEYYSIMREIIMQEVPCSHLVDSLKAIKARDKNRCNLSKPIKHVENIRIKLIKENKFKLIYDFLRYFKVSAGTASCIVCTIKNYITIFKHAVLYIKGL